MARHIRFSIELICISIFSLVCYSLFYEVLFFTVFQSRDLMRTELLCSGHFFSFGPETSGGGNLSGPLYYYFIAPFYCWGGWLYVWYFFISLCAASATFIYACFRYFSSWITALLVLCMWLMSPYLLSNLITFVNASLLNVFVPFCLAGIAHFFLNTDKSKSPQFLYISLFITGLCTQFHGSFIFIPLSILGYLIFLSKETSSPNKKHLAISLIYFAIPIFFFILLKIFTAESINPVHQPNSSILEHVKNLLSWQVNVLISEYSNHYDFAKQFLYRLYYSVPLQIALLPILVFLYKHKLFKNYKSLLKKKSPFFKYLFCLIFISSYGFISTVIAYALVRYTIVFSAAQIFMIGLLLHCFFTLDKQKLHLSKYWVICFSLILAVIYSYLNHQIYGTYLPWQSIDGSAWKFAIVVTASLIYMANLYCKEIRTWTLNSLCFFSIALCFSQTHSYYFANSYLYRNTSDLMLALEKAKSMTDWSYSELKKNLYLVNIWGEQDYRFLYEEIQVPVVSKTEIDGFFLTLASKFDVNNKSEISKSLVLEAMPNSVKELLLKDKLQWIEPVQYGFYNLLPYKFKENVNIDKLHTFGFSYEDFEENSVLKNLPTQQEGFLRNDSETLFYWQCPELLYSCATGIQVQHINNRLRVTVLGLPLAQNSRWTQPFWTEAWENIELTYVCKGKENNLQVIDYIGNQYHIIKHEIQYNPLAPFSRSFPLECIDKVTDFKVSIDKAFIYQLRYEVPTIQFRSLSTY